MTTDKEIQLAIDLAAINGILLEEPNQPIELMRRILALITVAETIAEVSDIKSNTVLAAILTRNGV